jgi:Sortase domain
MRTIAAVLGLVAVIVVMANLRTRTGMELALGQRPLAAPCQPGSPTRMSIPALGVDAPIEAIGLDRRARPDDSAQAPLGVPVDKRKAGWYAVGPKPGSGMGTVLTNGHTYRDGSAIFQEDFAAVVAVGQQINLALDNGTTCSYRISTVWRNVDAVQDYPRLVASEHLYDQQGTERLFLATCGGPWLQSARKFKDINVVLASPVPS